jgi:hypothetical protein
MSSMLGAISGDCSATGNGPLPKVALLCMVAYQTHSGQIVANGMLKLGTSSVLPIVGETGAYAPARGTLTTDVTPAKGFSEADRITLSRRPQSLPRRFDINVARGPRARADRTGATNSPTRAARATLGHPAPQRTAACLPRPRARRRPGSRGQRPRWQRPRLRPDRSGRRPPRRRSRLPAWPRLLGRRRLGGERSAAAWCAWRLEREARAAGQSAAHTAGPWWMQEPALSVSFASRASACGREGKRAACERARSRPSLCCRSSRSRLLGG